MVPDNPNNVAMWEHQHMAELATACPLLLPPISVRSPTEQCDVQWASSARRLSVGWWQLAGKHLKKGFLWTNSFRRNFSNPLHQFEFSIVPSVYGIKMPEEEYTEVPVKFIEDLSHKIEQLQHSLKRKQRILNKVSFYYKHIFHDQPTTIISTSLKIRTKMR